VRKEAGY